MGEGQKRAKSNEAHDLLDITVVQTVETKNGDKIFSALFSPLLVVGIFMSHIQLFAGCFYTMLTLHAVYLQDNHTCCFQYSMGIESHTHKDMCRPPHSVHQVHAPMKG